MTSQDPPGWKKLRVRNAKEPVYPASNLSPFRGSSNPFFTLHSLRSHRPGCPYCLPRPPWPFWKTHPHCSLGIGGALMTSPYMDSPCYLFLCPLVLIVHVENQQPEEGGTVRWSFSVVTGRTQNEENSSERLVSGQHWLLPSGSPFTRTLALLKLWTPPSRSPEVQYVSPSNFKFLCQD